VPSAFTSCRACGKPVYVGAKRCPNCHAATSWRSRLRSNLYPLLVLALFVLVVVYAALYYILWSDQTGTSSQRQESAPPAPTAHTATPGDRLQLQALALTPLAPRDGAEPGAGNRAQTSALPMPPAVTALKRRQTERAEFVTVRGRRIEPGMSADSLFELVSERDLLGQTMELDPGNPSDLRFTKYYRIDQNEFSVELRKSGRNAPYTVTSILVQRSGELAKASR